MEGVAVKLIIKTPNQQIKDQVVKCDIGWTIGRLKEYLSEVYPNKPVSWFTCTSKFIRVKFCESSSWLSVKAKYTFIVTDQEKL